MPSRAAKIGQMGKPGYRALIWGGLLLVLFFVSHFVWLSSAKGSYPARVEALRRAGEPVTLADLAEASVSEDQNGAPLLLRAKEYYEREAKQPICLDDHPENWNEAERAEVAAYLERCKPFFDLLKEAAAKPKCRFDNDWEAGVFVSPDRTPLMNFAGTALHTRVREKPETVIESIALLLDLSQNMERKLVITEMMHQGRVVRAFGMLKRAAKRPGFDARRARAVLEPRFKAAVQPGQVVKVLRCERAFALWCIGRRLQGDGRGGSDGDRYMEWALAWLRSPITYGDGSCCLDLFEEAIGLAKRGQSFDDFERRVEKLGENYVIARGFARLPGLLRRLTMQHESRMRVATRGLAALEHRRATGSWPADLDRTEADGVEGGVRIADGDIIWVLEPR